MAPLVDVDPALRAAFDVERNARQDELFAKGMNSGMTGYEMAVAERKKALFARLFECLPADREATVVEVGMGTFPNAPYYFDPVTYDCALPYEMLGSSTLCRERRDAGGAIAPTGRPLALDLVGIDPNDAMEDFARRNLAKASGPLGGGTDAGGASSPATTATLRIAHGVAEALPLESASADAVVCTLTLCSVADPARAVAEIRRVLKPGAPFVFVEHVLSEDDPKLAAQQISLNSLQVAMADGCHLDRKTLDVIEAAGFASFEAVERFTLPGFGLISSQVSGIAFA
jgi:SAM-dependent methyltransferase